MGDVVTGGLEGCALDVGLAVGCGKGASVISLVGETVGAMLMHFLELMA